GCMLATDCNDGNGCTIDACDATGACTHTMTDADGDGHAIRCTSGGTMYGDDCDDANGAAHPGAPEICNDDADDDCDGNGELMDDDVACEWLHCNATDDACDTPASISAGGSHVCIVTGAGHLFCWGQNDLGEIGTGT